MLEKEKTEIIAAGIKLDRYGLISLSGGNVSVRVDQETLLVTPSGMMYEEMVPADVLVMNSDGKVIEGARRPSVDTIAIRYIFQQIPEVNAVIHTHQPYATGIGLVVDRIDCDVTTLANTAKGPVNVAPYSSAASIDMGYAVVDHIGDQLAVVLKNHGVVTIGKNLKEALYAAVYLEEAAKTLYVAHSYGGDIAKLNDEQIRTAVEVFKDYGQVKQ
ncbi:L-ribulose-5-phosphate 4-epimerase [Enterococcus avium]|uniref:class II aldolase/adducin family protein n=1 Tax=Enterococcus malodoratus TaxID=71451 RepID=UPI0008B450B7|nr:class II aldolase/adducin family protein [Enterococcus malodoratus]BBM19925.1 L-ribulose-5-phosphate 4-epimerase [Enterococcus avium]SET24064.1 L-ribulose-5-phosphate 4-epimerase [Enterococcus malodoratus]